MKRLMLGLVIATALGAGGGAHAACTGSGASVGVSDVFRAKFGAISIFARTIAPGVLLGGGPAMGADVCGDGTAAPVQETHVVITDTSSATVLCDVWADATHASLGYDPFGFPGFWDALTFALNVPTSDPTHVEGVDVGADATGAWAAHKKGAIAIGSVWWSTGSLDTVKDTDGSIARGVGVVTWPN
jgi:hypothetical protein